MVWRSTEISKDRSGQSAPVDVVVLAHDQRHIRRKLLHLANGDMVMLDLKEPVHLDHGDRLLLDDGNQIEVVAANEELLEIVARDQLHLVTLAWHLGNRHLPAQIEQGRILIQRDHIIGAMLAGLGAVLREVNEPFHPVKGAYHDHGGHKAGHGH